MSVCVCVVQMLTCECVCCVIHGIEPRAIAGKCSTAKSKAHIFKFWRAVFLEVNFKISLAYVCRKRTFKNIRCIFFKSNGCQISSYKIIKYTQDMF